MKKNKKSIDSVSINEVNSALPTFTVNLWINAFRKQTTNFKNLNDANVFFNQVLDSHRSHVCVIVELYKNESTLIKRYEVVS